MKNIEVATFDDDRSAIEGLHKLHKLQQQGDIDLDNNVLLRRNEDGSFAYLKDDRYPDGWATLGGVVFGSLLGVLGGPVGVVVGLFSGLAIGGMADVARFAFDTEFLDAFKNGLPAGTTSIVAEIGEPSSVFVDNALSPLGARVVRSDIHSEKDKYFQSEVDQMDREIDEADKELDAAVEADRKQLEEKVAKLKAKRDAKVAEIKATLQSDVDSMKAGVQAVKQNLQADIDSDKRRMLEAKLTKTEDKIKRYEAQAAKLTAEAGKYKSAPAS